VRELTVELHTDRRADTLLAVEDLHVRFETEAGTVHAVRGASFSIGRGQTLGIVGESGSGKSATAQSLLGLVPEATVTGTAHFEGEDLLALDREELRLIRGRRISMVFQDPLTSLHPLYRIGRQVAEALRVHTDMGRAAARDRAAELLGMVGIPRPKERLDDYPHQFSGGMRQRVMIAMALALDPALIIADEPTTALDATVQAQVLELLVKLQQELGTSLILITHDLGVVADLADDVMVMYAGRPVEVAERRTAYYEPHHPYTRGLLRSIPVAGRTGGRLPAIPGQPPSMLREPAGCAFAPRCTQAFARCSEDPPLRAVGSAEHQSACWLPTDPADPAERTDPTRPGEATEPAAAATGELETAGALAPARPKARGVSAAQALMELTGVVKHFPVGSNAFIPSRGRPVVHAVDGVDLTVRKGETLGLVGETGCGKSTLARCMAGLQPLTAGQISYDGRDLTAMSSRGLREMRREIQVVFQDPYGSLNPRRRVGSIIAEPLHVHRIGSKADRHRRVQELMELVGLNPEHYERYPSEFSGGQRQRIGIARALAVEPRLLICDEPVSALDVSVQAQVINLLQDLRDELGLTCVFISHDLGVVEHVSDRVAVMYLGEIVELSSAPQLYRRPRHPYSAALLSAASVPDPDRARARRRIVVTGDVPSPVDPPRGCRFHPRCPNRQDRCTTDGPQLEPESFDEAHFTACHFPVNTQVQP
jgi:oligopeptide/dipeptide ABC transporter ATP-binding protein